MTPSTELESESAPEPSAAPSNGPAVKPANRPSPAETAEAFVRLAALPEGPARDALRAEIIESHLALARHVASRYRNRGEPEDDLVQVARLGLVKAVDRFDPDRGVVFGTFAIPTMMGEVRRYFRDAGWSVHVPRRLQELHLKVEKAAEDLAGRSRRPPTPEEIARYLDIPAAEVYEGIEVGAAYQTRSLDHPARSGDDGGIPLAELLPAEEEPLAALVDRQSLRPLLAELTERERKITYLRFFESMSQSQIGAEVGISQMQVSRILSAVLERLRNGLAGPS